MGALLNPELKELWVANGVKAGKTLAAASSVSSAAWIKKGGLYRWVAPIYTQSKIGMSYCKKILPRPPETNVYMSGLPRIEIPRQETSIEFWHGQHPEDLEGEGCMGYVLDECSKMKQQVYDSAHTTTTVTRGGKVCISTPRGKNWFYKKCMDAKERMDWAIKNGKPITHMFITAPSSSNPAVGIDAIVEGRRTLPDRLFRQYYLAEFVDDGDVFSGYQRCIYLDKEIDETDNFQYWVNNEYEETKDKKANVSVVIGADWGKKNDYTVFTAWDYKKRKLIGFCRFRGIDYIDAVRRLVWFSDKFDRVEMILHDKTGLGDVLDDIMSRTTLPYEGVIFTNKSKSHMVNNIMIAFQQNEILIPRWKQMMEEIESYEVTTSEIGNMKYSAPDGMHDDIIASMILGWTAVLEYTEHSMEVKMAGDVPKSDGMYEQFLRQAQEELEDNDPSWKLIKGLR